MVFLTASPFATIVLDDKSGLLQHQQTMSIFNAANGASVSTIAGRRVTWTSATEIRFNPRCLEWQRGRLQKLLTDRFLVQ